MSTLLQTFTSQEWTLLVKTLLHTLWQGGVAALALAVALRFCANAVVRYRLTLATLAVVLLAGFVTWSALEQTPTTPVNPGPLNELVNFPTTPGEIKENGSQPVVVVVATPAKNAPPTPSTWTAWLALVWVFGAGLMLVRAGAQVAGAERLRRSCHPVADSRVNELLAEARRAIGIVRQVRIVVTEQLTSPAVVGVFVPTLILPLSLITTLSHEQIRFILLHELAHIRRGDYLANLFQLLAEALLFFNPAVWWISHQIRREREACCDALAIELSGAPADYAKTLVHVAEKVLIRSAVATAFGNEKEPSSLNDRIQRLLVPGYRPTLRLTWRAMLAALFLGGALLVLSAVGTRVTFAAAAKLLTPQERVERIEQKMTEYGQKPEAMNFYEPGEKAPQVELSGRIRTADGTLMPKWVSLSINSYSPRSSYGTAINAREGSFVLKIRQGEVFICGELTNYAPAVLGPIDAVGSNRIENLELVLTPGFDVQALAVDAETGKPIPDATFRWQLNLPNGRNSVFVHGDREVQADASGLATLNHCADLPLDLTLDAPGYELAKRRFDSIQPGKVFQVTSQRALPTTGVVIDKATGTPISGAAIGIFQQDSSGNSTGYGWDNSHAKLAVTDDRGAFVLRQLRRDSRYWLTVTAPGRESLLLGPVIAGQSNLVKHLGPELIVKGRIVGDLSLLTEFNGKKTITAEVLQSDINNSRNVWNQTIEPIIRDGVGYFEFTNRIAGLAKVIAGGRSFDRIVDSPVDDWIIELKSREEPKEVAKREVIFRFKDSTGIPLKGVVSVSIPDNVEEGHLTVHDKEFEIQNGEVRAEMPIGGRTSIEPKQTVGFWFKNYYSSIVVSNGVGPMVVEVPVIPAGAIYAKALNSDGTPASRIFFSVMEVKPSPLRESRGPLDGGMDSPTTKWVSGALPLEGTYQVVGWRDNSFCTSDPVTLTEEKPDTELQLKFPPVQNIGGVLLDANGRAVPNSEVVGTFTIREHGFGLKPSFTDQNGAFHFEGLTPGIGEYTLRVGCPGSRAEIVPVDFARLPMTIRLQSGARLSGQVIDAENGRAIPNAEIRAFIIGNADKRFPQQTTRTASDGKFEFDTLADATYSLYVNGANFPAGRRNEIRAGQGSSITLRVIPYSTELKALEVESSRPEAAAVEKTASALNAEGHLQIQKNPGTEYEYKLKATQPTRALSAETNALIQTSAARRAIFEKLKQIRLDSLSFDSVPLSNVIRELSRRVRELDPEKKGVNFLINPNDLQGNPFKIMAESADFDIQKRILQASNNVVLKHTNVIIRADTATVNHESGEVLASGHVIFQQGDQIATGSSIRYNFQTGGMRLVTGPSPARQAIMSKFLAIRLPSVSYNSVPLSEVILDLSRQVRELDPETKSILFLLNPNPETIAIVPNQAAIDPATGLRITNAQPQTADIGNVLINIDPPLTNVSLGEVLEAVVVTADQPIKSSFSGFAVVFSPKGRETPQLHMGRFSVDTNVFMSRRGVTNSSDPKEIQQALLKFLSEHGVDISPQTGRNVFYSGSRGDLMVRATSEELDRVEKALNGLGKPLSQVNIKTRFFAVPREVIQGLQQELAWTNSPATPARVMTIDQMRALQKQLSSTEGASLGQAEVTTLSGRQCQIQMYGENSQTTISAPFPLMTNSIGAVPTVSSEKSLTTNSVSPEVTTNIIDVVPNVSADGITIQLDLGVTRSEFLGFDDPGPFRIGGGPVQRLEPLPHYRLHQYSGHLVLWDGQSVAIFGEPMGVASPQGTQPAKYLLGLVTVTLIDPAGNRVHSDEDLPFTRDRIPAQNSK